MRFVACALLLVACSGPGGDDAGPPGADAGVDSGSADVDSGPTDAGAGDAAASDSGVGVDAGPPPPPLGGCPLPAGSAPDYGCAAAWVCHPGMPAGDDVCRGDLDATEVLPDGSLMRVAHVPAADPTFDCFYVYPTVHPGLIRSNELDPADTSIEREVTLLQAARFSEVCRVFAPLYRQASLGNYIGARLRRDDQFNVAADDVEAAFDHYLTHNNAGRPFVLVGHSQGAQQVTQLLQARFRDGSALRSQLVVAMPIGWAVSTSSTLPPSAEDEWPLDPIPPLPLCATDTDFGCVLPYRSYAGGHPMESQLTTGSAQRQVACVNPAGAASSGVETLAGAYFGATPPRAYVAVPAAFDGSTPFIFYRDFFGARCVTESDNSGLEITVEASDGRANPIDFDHTQLTGNPATHGLDVSFALDDLIDTAAARAASRAGG